MTPTPNDDHLHRLTLALHALLRKQRVAALGTCNEDGTPFVSMVPFAIDSAAGAVVIHVSGLAPHTRNLQAMRQVSLLVMESEEPGAPVHALPRVTLEGSACVVPQGDPAWTSARSAYLERFPEAEPMTQLGDFRFVAITLSGARQVAGFGAARSVDATTLAQLLGMPPSQAS
jgi:putative heme iron utilization protein